MEKINQKKFESLVGDLTDRAAGIRHRKGKDYSEDNDRLANFRRLAERLGVHPRMIWAVFFMKQVDAAMTWAKEGSVASESIEDRFADIINYCHLGWAIEKACDAEGTFLQLSLRCSDCGKRYTKTQDAFCPHEERETPNET